MNKRKIIITGKNYIFILGMVRALKNFKYEIIVLSTQNKQKKNIPALIKNALKGRPIESVSKYIDKYIVIGNGKDTIINKLMNDFSNEAEKPILIPTDDYTLSVFDKNYNKLSKKFILPNINKSEGKITEMLDKSSQKIIAEKCGLKVAKEFSAEIIKNKIAISNDIQYPVFIKPLSSFKGIKDYMKKCDNKEQLTSCIKEIPNIENCPLLIEEYINIENEYGILGCSYNGNIYIPGIIKKIKVGKGSQKGVTLLGETRSIDEFPELHLKIEKFISTMKFNGLFDVEIFESNGEFYFSEVNLRFGVYGYALTKIGVNIPEMYLEYILNKKITERKKITRKIFINEKVCFDNYANNLISYKEYKENRKKIDFGFIYDKEDKKPYYSFKRQEILQHMKKIIKKII